MKIRKFVQLILSAILGLMGCSECAVEEYGCPSADFEMKGKVVNEKGEAMPECNSPRKISSECSGNVLRSLVIHGEGAVRYEEAFDGCNSGGTP